MSSLREADDERDGIRSIGAEAVRVRFALTLDAFVAQFVERRSRHVDEERTLIVAIFLMLSCSISL